MDTVQGSHCQNCFNCKQKRFNDHNDLREFSRGKKIRENVIHLLAERGWVVLYWCAAEVPISLGISKTWRRNPGKGICPKIDLED